MPSELPVPCMAGGAGTGWCSRDPVLSLKLPSSFWVGDLVPVEELKGISLNIYSLRRNQGPALMAALSFPNCFSFVSAPPPLPDNQLFESALWNSGKVRRLHEAYFPQTRNRGHRKDLYPGETHRVPFHFVHTYVSLLWGFEDFFFPIDLLYISLFQYHAMLSHFSRVRLWVTP